MDMNGVEAEEVMGVAGFGQRVKVSDVVGTPAGLPRIETHLRISRDVDMHSPSPPGGKASDEEDAESNAMLLDLLIEETVGDVLLGDSFF